MIKPVTLEDKPLVEYTDKHKKTISSEKGLAIGMQTNPNLFNVYNHIHQRDITVKQLIGATLENMMVDSMPVDIYAQLIM